MFENSSFIYFIQFFKLFMEEEQILYCLLISQAEAEDLIHKTDI